MITPFDLELQRDFVVRTQTLVANLARLCQGASGQGTEDFAQELGDLQQDLVAVAEQLQARNLRDWRLRQWHAAQRSEQRPARSSRQASTDLVPVGTIPRHDSQGRVIR
jgi:hypothetical protein